MSDLSIDPVIPSTIDELQKSVNFLAIESVDDMTQASNVVSRISELQTKIENQRKEFTQPLNTSLKNINAFFKKFSTPLETIDNLVRGKMVTFQKENTDLGLTRYGAIHFTKRQVIKVVDEAKVPKEYFSVDMAKIKQGIKDGKKIDGIEVVEEHGVSL